MLIMLQMLKSCESAVVELLCKWPITPNRLGEYQAAVVAKLIDKRQVSMCYYMVVLDFLIGFFCRCFMNTAQM